MVFKKKITKVKSNFHMPPKKKPRNSSGIDHKTNSPHLVNATKLPYVHVSLTRLMPSKMPDIAKEQYYKLLKSSDLLSVIPAENATWDALSPETTPEREPGKTSRNSDLFSPITRTLLQSSPVDLDANCADLSNEPWSDSPEPYPSPKSAANNESIESVEWFTLPTVKKPWTLEHEVDAELLCRNSCDTEVEAIMARQNCEVPKDSPDISVHRPHPNKSLLKTIAIPLQPVDTSLLTLDVYQDHSPVFERNGIWTTPARELSVEKTSGAVEKKGLKRKLGRPKKQKKVLELTNSLDLKNSNDEERSPSPLATGVQASEQEDTEIRKSECEEGTLQKDTKLVAEKRTLEKSIAKPKGRPRKRRRLHSVEAPALKNSVEFNCSNDSSKSTLFREPSNDEVKSPSPLTNGVQASEQEKSEEEERKCDEATSKNNTQSVAEKRSVEKGIAKKIGRPRKSSSDSSKSTLLREPSNDDARSPSLTNGVQASEQENTDEHERKCDKGTSKNNTKLVAEKRSVEKAIAKKIGRPRKSSSDSSKSTLLREPSNDEVKSPSPLTNGVQTSEQEKSEEEERKCDEGTSKNNTKLVAEKSSVEKGIAKKLGRPRKNTKKMGRPGKSSSDSSKSTLLCETSNDDARSPSLTNGVQASEQEKSEEHERKCDEGTSKNNTKSVAEKRSVEKGIAKKIGRPRKSSSDSSKSTLLREPLNDEVKSPSPLTNGVQTSEQEKSEEEERKCDEGTSKNNTKLVAEKRSVEKGIAKKLGRPRKNTKKMGRPRKSSSDSSKSTLLRETSNDDARSPSLTNGDQASEQEKSEEHERKCDEGTSKNNTKSVAEKRSVEKGIAKKIGRPRKSSSDSSKSTLLREPLNDEVRSPSPLTNGVQASEQENTDEHERNGDEDTSKNITKLVAGKRSVEKGIAKKIGRPRKRSSLHSVEAPALNNSMDLNCSNDSAKSTLLHEPSEPHETREQHDETCQNEVRVSPVILETTIGSSTSQERAQVSKGIKEQKMTENREDRLNPQIVEDTPQRSGTPHQHTPVLIEIETSSSEGSDLHSPGEVTFKQMPEEDDDQVKETPVTPQIINKWLSAVNIETSPLIKSLELNKKQNGAKSPPKATVFLQDQGEMRQISSNSESNNNIHESIQQDRLISARQELFPDNELSVNVNVSKYKLREQEPSVESTLDPIISPRPLELIVNGELPILSSNGKDTSSGEDNTELLEGKVHIVPCSPIQSSKSPTFEGRQRTFSSSSIASSRSDTACNGTISFTEKANTSPTNLGRSELSKESFDRQRKSSMDHMLPQTPHSPPSSPTTSTTSLLDGTLRLTPCSPVQSPQISTFPRHRNSLDKVSPPNGFKTPVPLKELVVKCDRVTAEKYNILKIPENLLPKFLKQNEPKRKRRKVDAEKKTMDEKKKEGKTGKKRKRENNSNKKPRKKRKLGIPNHYKSYKSSQLPTISHTNMRYRVAFTLWPQKYSGALDKINQRLINQNSFWNSLG